MTASTRNQQDNQALVTAIIEMSSNYRSLHSLYNQLRRQNATLTATNSQLRCDIDRLRFDAPRLDTLSDFVYGMHETLHRRGWLRNSSTNCRAGPEIEPSEYELDYEDTVSVAGGSTENSARCRVHRGKRTWETANQEEVECSSRPTKHRREQ